MDCKKWPSPKTSSICAFSVPKEKEKKGKTPQVQIQEAWANHKIKPKEIQASVHHIQTSEN